MIYGDRTRTFAELAGRVARLAGALRALGVGPGDRVAMLSLNSDRYIEYLFAVPWAGAVLNPVNIRWNPVEIAYSLQDSGTELLLVDDRFAPVVPALRDKCPGLRTVIHSGDAPAPAGTLDYEALLAENEPVEDAIRGGDDLAGIFYTGGTTGFPKGVMLTHANLLTSALGWLASGEFLTRGGRFLHAAPMFHLADLAAWTGQTVAGGTHVVIPMFEPGAVLKAIEAHRVTDALLVPTMIQLLVDNPAIASHDLSSLRRLFYGASSISAAVLKRAMKALPG
ncbi:MAG TPA: AMP-binding protein, partial [Kofleriaceae bacterium]|nr:AMP-binding protein [Kofleriaceae bacterium]